MLLRAADETDRVKLGFGDDGGDDYCMKKKGKKIVPKKNQIEKNFANHHGSK